MQLFFLHHLTFFARLRICQTDKMLTETVNRDSYDGQRRLTEGEL